MQQLSIASFRGKLILIATILASGFVFLFGSAISVALPAIQAEFDAPLSGIQWIVNIYTLVSGVFILLSGAVSDIYGRKRIFVLGTVFFIVGLLLSGFASGIYMLIGFQIILGIGAGMMVPVSLAIVRSCFFESERGRVIGLWVGLAAVFAAAGPFAGGVMVDVFGWRSVFFSLIPIAFLILLMVHRFVPETKAYVPGTPDLRGATTLGLALFGALFVLIQGPTFGWGHGAVIIGATVSAFAFLAFIYIEDHATDPIIPPSLFRNPRVLGANLATVLLYFVLGGTLFFLTLNFQQVQGMSAAQTGVALLPPVILIALFSGLSGRLVDVIGPRLPMVGGPLLVALGVALLLPAGAHADYLAGFFPGLVLIGAGMTVVIPALTKSAMSVADRYSGAASGVNNAASRTSWLFAVAVLGAVAQVTFMGALEQNLRVAELPTEAKQILWQQHDRFGGIELPATFDEQVKKNAREIIDSAFIKSFRSILIINTLLALFASLISFFYIRNTSRPRAQNGGARHIS